MCACSRKDTAWTQDKLTYLWPALLRPKAVINCSPKGTGSLLQCQETPYLQLEIVCMLFGFHRNQLHLSPLFGSSAHKIPRVFHWPLPFAWAHPTPEDTAASRFNVPLRKSTRNMFGQICPLEHPTVESVLCNSLVHLPAQ